MATVIGNIRRALPPGKAGWPEGGELVVDGDTIEFRGKKGTFSLSGVRAVTREPNSGVVRIAYGSPEATERFLDYRRGKLRLNSQADVLVNELRTLLGLRVSGGEDMSDTAKQAVAHDAMRSLGKRMAITAAIFVVGLVVTIVTYTRAREEGGSYFVAWGAILFGAIAFIEAAVKHAKASRMFREAGGVPGQPPAKEPIPDVAALKGARDVDGLVRALWHDEFSVRVDVMDALAEIREPRAVDLLITSLTSRRWDVRWSAAEALGKLGEPRAIEPLRGVLNDDNALVRAVAEQSIQALEKEPPPMPSPPVPSSEATPPAATSSVAAPPSPQMPTMPSTPAPPPMSPTPPPPAPLSPPEAPEHP